jgi:TRAP-type uncharacterized transport system substrate-binding protein
MGKVLIEIEEGKMDEFRIKKMRMKQLKRALKKVQEIISIFEEDENTADLISYFMDMEKTEVAVGEDQLKDKMFMENILAAMKMLFNRVPDELTELVAIISKIEEELLDEQDYDVFLDVVIECIKENDIKAMINKGKEAFTMGKNLWGGIKG